MAHGTKPKKVQVSKGKEGSAGEEAAESPHQEAVEDMHNLERPTTTTGDRSDTLKKLWAPDKKMAPKKK